MSPVEIIAVIFAIVVLVKFLQALLLKPKCIMKWAEKMYPKTALFSLIMLVLIAAVGYYLLAELTIAQIFAAALFGMLLYGLILIQYPKELLKFSGDVLKNKQKAMLPWLLFVVIAVWVLYSVFA